MSSYSRQNSSSASFENFVDSWIVRHEIFSNELLRAQETYDDDDESCEDAIRSLISRVLSHLDEYYREKSRMIQRDVFIVFSPPWFTPLERAFFWVAGFRPEFALSLLMKSVNDLTEDQTQRIQCLRRGVQVEEGNLTEELASFQESVAAPPSAELAKQVGRRVVNGGGERNSDGIPEEFRLKLMNLLIDADLLRRRMVEEVVQILSPHQNLRFLASAIQLHLRIRAMGRQRQAEAVVEQLRSTRRD